MLKSRMSIAVASALFTSVAAPGALAQGGMLEEVVVTATKRAASMQDIPVAVNAMTENKLDDFGVANFANYMTQLPGVTAGGAGPGHGKQLLQLRSGAVGA